MRCRYEETRCRNENDGYCVLCYSTEDPEVPEGARNKYRGEDRFIFTAVGTELPAKKDQEVELNGRWVKSKYGLQLSVESLDRRRNPFLSVFRKDKRNWTEDGGADCRAVWNKNL